MKHLSGCAAGDFGGCTCHEIRAARISKINAAKEISAKRDLIYEALRFAVWAAGEGICPAPGELATDPADFLLEYSKRVDTDDDWDALPETFVSSLFRKRHPRFASSQVTRPTLGGDK